MTGTNSHLRKYGDYAELRLAGENSEAMPMLLPLSKIEAVQRHKGGDSCSVWTSFGLELFVECRYEELRALLTETEDAQEKSRGNDQ